MVSNWPSVIEDMIQRRIGSRIDAVCSVENESVDIEKIAPAQMIAGHHARSHCIGKTGWGAGNGDASGGFCQG